MSASLFFPFLFSLSFFFCRQMDEIFYNDATSDNNRPWTAHEDGGEYYDADVDVVVLARHETLVDAVRRNIDEVFWKETIPLMLDNGADIHSEDFTGKTALHIVCQYNCVSVCDILISRGANVEAKDKQGRTPLYHSILCGVAEIAKHLIEHARANVHTTDSTGCSLMHASCRFLNLDFCVFLAGYGVPCDTHTDTGGDTPLHVVCDRFRKQYGTMGLAFLEFLVKKQRVRVNALNNKGQTPLMVAAEADNLHNCKYLLENGADATIKDKNGWTVLMYAACTNNKDLVMLFFNHKVTNFDIPSKDGSTILHVLAKRGMVPMFTFLMTYGANPSIKDNDGRIPYNYITTFPRALYPFPNIMERWTPLHAAISKHDMDSISYLLGNKHELKVNMDALDMIPQTPLQLAIRRGFLDVAKMLLDHGAVWNASPNAPHKPLCLAARYGNYEICELLINHAKKIYKSTDDDDGTKTTLSTFIHGPDKDTAPLHVAVESGHVRIVKLLLENHANVNCKDRRYSTTPLYYAAVRGDVDLCALLLDNGADINAALSDETRSTPFIIAIHGRNSILCNFLLDRGADIDASDEDGVTPLHHYCRALTDNYPIVEMLIKRGANLNRQTRTGETPLHMITRDPRACTQHVFAFMKHGALLDIVDQKGRTPLHRSIKTKNRDLCLGMIAMGSNVHIRSKSQKTALYYASKTANTYICETLLEFRADVNAASSRNISPLHLAAMASSEYLCSLYVQYGADLSLEDAYRRTPDRVAKSRVLRRFLFEERNSQERFKRCLPLCCLFLASE